MSNSAIFVNRHGSSIADRRFRILTFEACSGFTHVKAHRIAQPPKATFVARLQPFRLPGRALVSFQINRQLSGWNPSTGDRAFGAHGQNQTHALFRRLFLKMLLAAHHAGHLQFFGDHVRLADKAAFKAYLTPLREIDWVVYAKEPFAGPEQVLRYLSRYTHRIAISNRRLLAADQNGVTFKWKDYRIEGPGRYKTMTLPTHEFIRRFLIHALPKGVHRIRHYGLFANGNRAANIARARELLATPAPSQPPETSEAAPVDESRVLPRPCPCCGGRMIIIETFSRGCQPKHRPTPVPIAIRIDTS